MLSKPNRLSLKTDRFRIEKEGKTLFSNFFTYIIAPRSELSLPARFTVLTSKKNFPLSVTRHQLKRQLTEILRHHLGSFRTGYDIILIPKKSILTATKDQILPDLLHTLNP